MEVRGGAGEQGIRREWVGNQHTHWHANSGGKGGDECVWGTTRALAHRHTGQRAATTKPKRAPRPRARGVGRREGRREGGDNKE